MDEENKIRYEWLPIKDVDYKRSREKYIIYLDLLNDILKIKKGGEKNEDLNEIQDRITKNNPWKKSIENKYRKFKRIADSDRPILIPLIEKEIRGFKNSFIRENLKSVFRPAIKRMTSRFGGKKTLDNFIINEFAKPFYEKLFSDFEHTIDGNFENPRVIILGINPKIEVLDHESYNLKDVYLTPFNSNRRTLYSSPKRKADKSYYFKLGGFFFRSKTKEEIKSKFMDRINNPDEITPYALWEFFPYASLDEENWFSGIPIGLGTSEIKEYFNFKRVLPSQIWLLCLLSFTIKKAILEDRELIIYLTKNKNDFITNFFDKYLKELDKEQEIDKNKIVILKKKSSSNRSFSKGNVENYLDGELPDYIHLQTEEEFYKSVWNI